jgi:hypothetical protein
MKRCRHCGQVISNDDGFNPMKILGDLHAKSVKKCKDQNIYPSNAGVELPFLGADIAS